MIVDLRCDYPPHAIDVVQHFIVPEPEDTEPLATHEIISPRVVCARIGVLTAIDFNNNQCLQACKVRDVGSNSHLSAKLVPFELTEAQVAPELALGVCHVLS
jgi:hypothetical protein